MRYSGDSLYLANSTSHSSSVEGSKEAHLSVSGRYGTSERLPLCDGESRLSQSRDSSQEYHDKNHSSHNEKPNRCKPSVQVVQKRTYELVSLLLALNWELDEGIVLFGCTHKSETEVGVSREVPLRREIGVDSLLLCQLLAIFVQRTDYENPKSIQESLTKKGHQLIEIRANCWFLTKIVPSWEPKRNSIVNYFPTF